MNISDFRLKYPIREMELSGGKIFAYRYYKHPSSKQTLLLLTGGIGLSELFYLHFERFAKDFSVITFDYQMNFETNGEFADAVAELLSKLNIKVWLVGQSLGGIVAQIIAKEHPEAVEGLVLSNTCSLSENMNEAANAHLMTMLESTEKSKKLLKYIPFGVYKWLIKRMVMTKKTGGFSPEEKQTMEGLCDIILERLTKAYELHMLDFLMDAENHRGMNKEQFESWSDKVLLFNNFI